VKEDFQLGQVQGREFALLLFTD